MIAAAPVALLLAVWRSTVGERQAATAQHQAETARIQVETAQRSLLNERYQRAVELLGSSTLAVRIGGIDALSQLAKEYPAIYHIPVVRLLCAFARNPPPDPEAKAVWYVGGVPLSVMREDVQAVMDFIRERHEAAISIEHQRHVSLDLQNADLRNANLYGADLRNVAFVLADLTEADLTLTKNSDSTLYHRANLSNAEFNFGGSYPAVGLTQGMIDEACADAATPPKLDAVLDARTGDQLVWHESPCSSDS